MGGMEGQQSTGRRALRPRARLLRTLGTDLISSEKVALIELVKNSYDADATVVLIRFKGPLSQGQGEIQVWDDGHGMDVNTLLNSWLDIATDLKKRRTSSESGRRRVLGEKGIGRLAAARLADEMFLTTRRQGSDEIRLLIDWREFDREGAYLDQVEIAWEIGAPSIFKEDSGLANSTFQGVSIEEWKHGHGTLLQLEKLSRTWNEHDLRELKNALSRLVRPRPNLETGNLLDQFRIILDLPSELRLDLDGEVGPPEELRSPHYRLVGSVDDRGQGRFHYTQLDPHVDEDIEVGSENLWQRKDRLPRSGPFQLDIEVWDRDRVGLDKVSGRYNLSEFRRLLNQVAGVSVYRDGFRVLPFGEVGDDWLGLDRRRVQNPTLRVSNNQVIGHVFISADTNADLRDQTNREGLMEGAAYDDIRILVQNSLAQIEQRRWQVRRETSRPNQTRGGLFRRFQLDEIRSALAEKYPSDKRLIGLVDAKSEEIKEGIEEVQRVISQYSRLATLGSLIDRVLYDGRTAVSRLKNIVRFAQRDMAKRGVSSEEKISQAKSHFNDTSVQADLLGTLFNQIEPFSGRKRGRPKAISLRKIAEDAVGVFSSEASDLGVAIEVKGGEGIEVTVDPSEILTVLVNLVQNSLYWLSVTSTDDLRVLVQLSRNADGSASLLVSDSGPGVPDDIKDTVFDAYFSTRPDGVGLGLNIAGNIIHDFYDGELTLVEDGPLPGATFVATMRRRV
jgi:signal transduction histidine kinase